MFFLWSSLISKYSVKKFLAISLPHPQKIVKSGLDYNTVLRLQIFFEILDNYWFFMLLKIHPAHAEWKYLFVLHI